MARVSGDSCSSVAEGPDFKVASSARRRDQMLLPSMRVDEPMLSIVATRRRAPRRSGATCQGAPGTLESSISAIRTATRRDLKSVCETYGYPVPYMYTISPINPATIHRKHPYLAIMAC